ncbi:MAG: OadG family protein [Clostridia bacterium]|nr:OadG family protein [Clostridia bacterium]
MVTTFQTLADTAWLSDSLKVTLIGLVVVFAVLAILIVLIEALHAMLKESKTADAPKVEVKKEPDQRISAGVMADAPEASEAEHDGDFIAAVSAAITCVTGNANFKIKSIKKG